MQDKFDEKNFKNEKINPLEGAPSIAIGNEGGQVDGNQSAQYDHDNSLNTQEDQSLECSFLKRRDCLMSEALDEDDEEDDLFSDRAQKHRVLQNEVNDAILNYRKKLIYSIREENTKFVEGFDEDAGNNTYFAKLQELLKECHPAEKFLKREDFWFRIKDSYPNIKQIGEDILNYRIESPTRKYISYLALSLAALLLSATILSITECTNRIAPPSIEKLSAALRSSNLFKFVVLTESIIIGIGASCSFFFQSKLSKELRGYLKELEDFSNVYHEKNSPENLSGPLNRH